jgi:hypothetical protein
MRSLDAEHRGGALPIGVIRALADVGYSMVFAIRIIFDRYFSLKERLLLSQDVAQIASKAGVEEGRHDAPVVTLHARF